MSDSFDGLEFSIASLEDFSQSACARNLITTFLEVPPPEWIPKQYGDSEPVGKHIDPANLEGMVDTLTPSSQRRSMCEGRSNYHGGSLTLEFMAKGAYMMNWSYGPPPVFAFASGWIPWSQVSVDTKMQLWISLVRKLCEVVNPVYGEIRNGLHPSYPFDLAKRLPDVPWISIYGAPYIKMFTEERILSAPFWKIERLPSGQYLLQATESPYEPIPEEKRSAIRRHLGEDAFMSGGRWRYRDGLAPDFVLNNR